ncbi:MAG TPA: Uma2 family endonuclease [Sphingomonas sp.]|jgi:Uma2 family endonuclease
MNRPAHVASHAPFAGFTATEFLRVVDSGALGDCRVELVQGEIVKMMPSYLAHGEANMRVGASLLPLFAGTARVAVDLMIVTGVDTIRAVDLAVVRPDAPSDRPVSPADVILAIEIAASSLAQDLGAKLVDYAAAGIATYWVVDLESQVVHAMRSPEGDTYRNRQVVRFGEPLQVPGTGASIVVA